MTVVETLLVLAVIPAAVYGLIALLTLWPKLTRPRARQGQEWEFPPVFWVANPSGVSSSAPAADLDDADLEGDDAAQQTRPSTARGGARGNW